MNLYKGPESHPDNPDFPQASPGDVAAARGPLGALGGPPSSPAACGGLLAGRRSVPALLAARRLTGGRRLLAARGSLVLRRAHKKASASSKNQGRGKTRPKYWGPRDNGWHGSECLPGEILVKQKNLRFHPGANVKLAKTGSLHALKAGIVQWRGEGLRKEVFVVPWEYVETKCVLKRKTLIPKKYEPWMGTHSEHGANREDILALREEWLQTEEGQAHEEKRAAKKERRNTFAAREKQRRRFQKLVKQGMSEAEAREDAKAMYPMPGTPEPVTACDSETEAGSEAGSDAES